MQLSPIIAAQGDMRTKARILDALRVTFENGVPPSVLLASPYALSFMLRDDQQQVRTARIDFDALFNYYAGHPNELAGFKSRSTKLLDRMAYLTYTYLRALHSRADQFINYTSIEGEAVEA